MGNQNSICRAELKWKGQRIVISAARLPEWDVGDREIYELMVMTKNGAKELEQRRFHDRNEAEEAWAETYWRYEEEADLWNRTRPLTGKYRDLAEALKSAVEAARAAVEANPDDGGTCNMDTATIYLPRYDATMVENAGRSAGVYCSKWGKGEYHLVLPVGGQGYRQTVAAEAARDALKALGYSAGVYYMID